MKLRAGVLLGLLVILFLLSRSSPVRANLCRIDGVSYDYPREAQPDQQIQVNTNVRGSCFTGLQRYYTVRVDLADATTGNTITASSNPVGYLAENFSVTVTDTAITPSISNASWRLQIRVYVIDNGGGGGAYLIDYHTETEAAIQIVATASVPELPSFAAYPTLIVVLASAIVVLAVNNSNPNLKRRHTNTD